MPVIRGIILDVDGTLVDSNLAHVRAWQLALQSEGLKFPLPAIQRLIGMGGDKLLPTLSGISENSEMGQRISQCRTRLFLEEYAPQIRTLPGAHNLLRKLKEEGWRIAIATSAKEEELKKILTAAGLWSLLMSNDRAMLPAPETLTRDDAQSSKPEPDLVECALEALHLPPEACLMLGDTPYDIHAAKMARVKTIALRSGGWDDIGLQGALAIYDHPQDLLNHWDRSPLGVYPEAA